MRLPVFICKECDVSSLCSLIKVLKIQLISREELFFLQHTPFAWIVWQLHWYLYVLYTALSDLWMNTTALYCSEYTLRSKCTPSMRKWFVWMPGHKQRHTLHLRRGKGLCWLLVLLWMSGQDWSFYSREKKSCAISCSYCALINKVRLHFRFSHPFTDLETTVTRLRDLKFIALPIRMISQS